MNELYKQLYRLEKMDKLLKFKPEDVCPIHLDHDSLQLMLKEDRASFIHHLKLQLRTSILMLQLWKRYMEEDDIKELLNQMKNTPENDIVSLFLLLEAWINKGVAKRYPKGGIKTVSPGATNISKSTLLK